MQHPADPSSNPPFTSRKPIPVERRMYTPVFAAGAQTTSLQPQKLRFKKPALITAVLAILLVAGVGSTLYMTSRAATPQFPAHIANEADFPLYMPASLPEGYSIDEKSFSAESGVVLYTLSRPGDEPIIISEQPRPKDIDMARFNKEQIKDGTPVSLTEGEAIIGQLGTNLAASVIKEQTWIIISDPSKKHDDAIKQLVRAMKLAK